MNVRELRALLQWLKNKDIHVVELEEADASVRIVMHPRRPAPDVHQDHGPDHFAPQPKLYHVTAHAQGVFLATHPLLDAPLAAAGDKVTVERVLGLLKVTELIYQPVLAGHDGRFVRALAANGALVEAGMPLFELDIAVIT